MLYNDYTSKLLGLQGGIVTDVEESTENLTIYVEMERKPHNCPCCGTATRTIHDYRKQRIKDAPSHGKAVVILLRKRRKCWKGAEKNSHEKAEISKIKKSRLLLCLSPKNKLPI